MIYRNPRWHILYADKDWVNYGGKWWTWSGWDNLADPNDRTYYVLEFINWEDAQGEQTELTGDAYRDYPNMYCGPREELPPGKYPYAVQITKVNPSWYSKEGISRALECCGNAPIDTAGPFEQAMALAEYGSGDVDLIRYGRNAHKLLREAKRFVR